MGNWNINIQGIGCHHNGKPEIDADLAAIEFVALLRKQGHNVECASFTHGGKIDLLAESMPGTKRVRGMLNGMSWEFNAVCRYEDVVMAFADPKGEYETQLNRNLLVTYRKARFGKSGTLSRGQSVEAVEGVIFNVANTSFP